jgi:hypothetical protein
MNWEPKGCGDYRLYRDGAFVARVFWIGNLWHCHAFLPDGAIETTNEVTLPEAKAWAERQLG